jgi:flavin-dependent dehydrogenase
MYDVAIIGGGPGGATLARLIGERYSVLLVDKRQILDSPGIFSSRKCCGGLLAPDAQRMLSKLGLGLPKKVLEEPQLFVVKATDIQRGLQSHYQRHYINMDRQKFDRWLLSLIPSDVDLRLNCRLTSYSTENNFFKLTLGQGGKIYVERARILVGADGAISKVR